MYPSPMDMQILFYVLAGILILIGLAGTILPMLPGVPIVFAGMLLAAWTGHFQEISGWTVLFLAVLAVLALLLDFVAGLLGAKRVGASAMALWGTVIGTIVGLFFGLLGIVLGPFFGAVAGELLSGKSVTRSAHVGLATWIGLLFGTLAKLALSFTMLGVFVFALLIP